VVVDGVLLVPVVPLTPFVELVVVVEEVLPDVLLDGVPGVGLIPGFGFRPGFGLTVVELGEEVLAPGAAVSGIVPGVVLGVVPGVTVPGVTLPGVVPVVAEPVVPVVELWARANVPQSRTAKNRVDFILPPCILLTALKSFARNVRAAKTSLRWL
jgi:hypothetical protein